jgi:peptide/nickel transport system substrate-binding protein
MNRSRPVARALLAVVALALVAAACGRSASSGGGTAGQVNPTKGLVTTTPAGTTSVSSVTWAVYRDVNSLDPIYAFDYPENTAISLMCESLLRQAPDGSIGPGLASLATPSPTTLVFTLKPGVTFWDGHPVTSADVVYSLDRNTDAALGGFYSQVFTRVKSIKATGSNEVTITLKQPDYWLQGELASMAGVVIEKSFAEAQGKKYGTPGGSIMCTGAYKLKSFNPGVGVTAVLNPHYWNTSVHPKVHQILIKGVPDASSFTSGMITGGLQGGFTFGLATLTQLEQNKNVTVYQGPGQSTDAFIVSNPKGVLANVKVRQALSDALNRQGIISSVYRGAALMPRWIANPGTFGYGKSVFTAAYDASPVMTQNLAAAKQLVAQAGATGKTFTIGTSNEISSIASVAGAYQAAAQAIGLKAKLKSVSANNYINFFTEAKARAGIDGFITVNYGDYADPAALLSTVAMPKGSQNYDNYNNPQITAWLNQARGTADPDQRAHLVAEAEQLAAKTLPWIPDAQPTAVLVMHKGLTGAVSSFSYMFAPWADNLGGTG